MNNIFTIMKFQIHTSALTSVRLKTVKCYVFWFMNNSRRNNARALITCFCPIYPLPKFSPLVISNLNRVQLSFTRSQSLKYPEKSNKSKVEAPAHKVDRASRLQ